MRGNVETYQNTFWMDIGVDCVHQPMYSVLVAILQYLPSGNGSPLFSTSDDFQGEASTFTNPILGCDLPSSLSALFRMQILTMCTIDSDASVMDVSGSTPNELLSCFLVHLRLHPRSLWSDAPIQ